MSALAHLEDRIDAVAAAPRVVSGPEDCFFYHSMDIPGYGSVEGEWDLRGREAVYLGHTPLAGKRVLELGTADGFLTFSMERQGADVVSYDLNPDYRWDAVPFARPVDEAGRRRQDEDWVRVEDDFVSRITRLNNAYWLCHKAFRSRARVVYGTVHAIPDEIGTVDVTTFGALLLHTKDPFGALASAARLTRETLIVTEARGRVYLPAALAWTTHLIPRRLRKPAMRFLPDWKGATGGDGWWRLSPEIVVAFLGVLGFEDTTVTHHTQLYQGNRRRLYTVVGRRTVA